MTVSEHFRDRVLTFRHSHDMNMIRHHAIRGDSQSKFFGVVLQQIEVPAMVRFVQEDIESAYTALSYVVRNFRTDNPSHSRHELPTTIGRIIASEGKGHLILVRKQV